MTARTPLLLLLVVCGSGLSSALVAASAATKGTGTEMVTVMYKEPDTSDLLKLDAVVDWGGRDIKYHTASDGEALVDTMEDYNTGYAASKVEDMKGCYLRRLSHTLQEAVDQLRQTASSEPQEYEGILEVDAAPTDDDLANVIGERLLRFCGDLTMHTLLSPNEDETAVDTERFFFRPFFRHHYGRCFRIIPFIYKCVRINVVFPTGLTLPLCFRG